MASRRKLKQSIRFTTILLIYEVYFQSLIQKSSDETAADKLITDIDHMYGEFIARINHPDGKGNAKLVKAYYKKLKDDLKVEVSKLNDRIASL